MMKVSRVMVALLVLLMACTAVAAAQTETADESSFSFASPDQPAAGSTEQKADPDKVLAKVGDRAITQGDLMAVLQNLEPRQAMFFATPQGQQRLLEQLINRELIYLWGKELNVSEEEAFQQQLEMLKSDLVRQYALQQLLGDVTVTEKEEKEYYDANSKDFMTKEQVEVSHILVSSEDKAVEVRNEIVEEGVSFDVAAREYSEGPTGKEGGKLGTISRGDVVPEFEEVAFALESGDISDPVKTKYGYHIIMVSAKKAAEQKPFEDVQGEIQKQLAQQKQRELYESKLEELHEQFPVEITAEPKKQDKAGEENKEDN
ncbi:MAG: peptidylprolyl isomerase [Synergistales bacterium]|nr:peptidylprolyl isomerase [Synergistales bacterium]